MPLPTFLSSATLAPAVQAQVEARLRRVGGAYMKAATRLRTSRPVPLSRSLASGRGNDQKPSQCAHPGEIDLPDPLGASLLEQVPFPVGANEGDLLMRAVDGQSEAVAVRAVQVEPGLMCVLYQVPQLAWS